MLVLGEAWFGPTMGLLQKAVRKSVAGSGGLVREEGTSVLKS